MEEIALRPEQTHSKALPTNNHASTTNAIGLIFETSSIGSGVPPTSTSMDDTQTPGPPIDPDVPDFTGWDAAQWETIWQSLVTQSDFASEEELRRWNLC